MLVNATQGGADAGYVSMADTETLFARRSSRASLPRRPIGAHVCRAIILFHILSPSTAAHTGFLLER